MRLKQGAESYTGEAPQSVGVATPIPEECGTGRMGVMDVTRGPHMGNADGLLLKELEVPGEAGDKRSQDGSVSGGDGLPKLQQSSAEIWPPSSRDRGAV